MELDTALPALVEAATARAARAGSTLSCEPAVGGLLPVLAAHVPQNAGYSNSAPGREGAGPPVS